MRGRYGLQMLEKPLKEITSIDHIPGWCDGRVLARLKDFAKGKEVVVNLGVWKGRSTAALASTCSGTVWAIDHFLGSPEERETNHKQAANDPLSVYWEFCCYMRHFGYLGTKVIPICATSQDATIYFPNMSIDLIFIDGGHDFDSVYTDLSRWTGRIKPGGIVCGDDYNWLGVKGAVTKFVSHYYAYELHVEVDGKFWWFERKTL